jgi:hypothetical protein
MYIWKCHKENLCVAILNKKKGIFFLLQNGEQEGGTGPAWGGNGWHQWGGRKDVRRWVWCKYCVHMHINRKMIPIETIQGMGAGGDEGEWWRGWIQVWYIWYIVRTFVNVTTYPYPAQ